MPRFRDGTIVAVATPLGRAAVSILRLSGPESTTLALQQIRIDGNREVQVRRPFLTTFLGSQGEPVDQILLTVFPAPASYTGEDVVEISCHGSPPVVRKVLETLLANGARLAEPGEFSLRAFLNQKMDLAQAEGVRDLIESQTEFQARVARGQIEGRLSKRLKHQKEDLVSIISHMETAVEFVEEDVEPEGRSALVGRLVAIDRELQLLVESSEFGRVVREGLRVSIVGRPNVGKSSLFNRLVREDRVIVTALPGTTRDAVAETIDLAGIPTEVVDTAGIREARGEVESLGVQKSLEYIQESDIVLFVIDGSRRFDAEDSGAWHLIKELRHILVVNKLDLPVRVAIPPEIKRSCVSMVTISALRGERMDELREALRLALAPAGRLEREQVWITSVRHKHCLEEARRHLGQAIVACERGLSEEFPLHDLRKVLEETGKITGETSVEDILGEIFATFCVGK